MKKHIEISLDSFLNKKLVNEGMTMDLDFNATIENIDVNGINEFPGVKSMNMTIKKITSLIEWEVDSEDLTPEEKLSLISAGGREYRNNTISGEIEVVTTQKIKDKDWTIDNEVEFETDGGLSIESIEVGFLTMTITVN